MERRIHHHDHKIARRFDGGEKVKRNYFKDEVEGKFRLVTDTDLESRFARTFTGQEGVLLFDNSQNAFREFTFDTEEQRQALEEYMQQYGNPREIQQRPVPRNLPTRNV